jgi:hypothetical protein
MTVTPNDYDEQLKSHTAIAKNGVCHAVVSGFDEQTPGMMTDKTECGIGGVDSLPVRRRIEFADDDVPMCDQCWPEIITADIDESHPRRNEPIEDGDVIE